MVRCWPYIDAVDMDILKNGWSELRRLFSFFVSSNWMPLSYLIAIVVDDFIFANSRNAIFQFDYFLDKVFLRLLLLKLHVHSLICFLWLFRVDDILGRSWYVFRSFLQLSDKSLSFFGLNPWLLLLSININVFPWTACSQNSYSMGDIVYFSDLHTINLSYITIHSAIIIENEISSSLSVWLN